MSVSVPGNDVVGSSEGKPYRHCKNDMVFLKGYHSACYGMFFELYFCEVCQQILVYKTVKGSRNWLLGIIGKPRPTQGKILPRVFQLYHFGVLDESVFRRAGVTIIPTQLIADIAAALKAEQENHKRILELDGHLGAYEDSDIYI